MATSNIMRSRRVTNDGLAYRSRRRSNRRGIALPLMGLLLAVFCAFMAIILDGGYLYFEKRRMQLAADAGSWDGAWELLRANTTRIVSAGRYSVRLNGYTHGVDGADVQITQLNATDVEAVVQKPVPTFFANVFNVSSATVAARAVSSIQYPAELCILALNETEDKAINITGTGIINVECGVQANSCFGNPNMGGGSSGGGNGAFRVTGPETVSPNSTPSGRVPVDPRRRPDTRLPIPSPSAIQRTIHTSIWPLLPIRFVIRQPAS